MKVYVVQRFDGVFVFGTLEKAIRDICYDDVEMDLNGKLVRVIGNRTEAELIERMKTRRAQMFSFEGRDIWLEVQEVR